MSVNHNKDDTRLVLFKKGSQVDLEFNFIDSDSSPISDMSSLDSVRFVMKRSRGSSESAISRDTSNSPTGITIISNKITITPTAEEVDALVEGSYVAEFALVYPSQTLLSETIVVRVEEGVA